MRNAISTKIDVGISKNPFGIVVEVEMVAESAYYTYAELGVKLITLAIQLSQRVCHQSECRKFQASLNHHPTKGFRKYSN